MKTSRPLCFSQRFCNTTCGIRLCRKVDNFALNLAPLNSALELVLATWNIRSEDRHFEHD